MSSLTLTEARNSIQATFLTAWAALSPAAADSATPVRVEWDGVDDGVSRDPQAPYAAVFINHAFGDRATLSDAFGSRRFTRRGTVTVMVYTPLSSGRDLSLAEKLATIARDAFEGVDTADGVWFQQVTVREKGSDDRGFYRMDVSAAFQYDEIK